MAMIVDTLVQYGAQAYTFTVNTAVTKVECNQDPAGVENVLSIGGVFNTFQWKDNLILLSVGVILPLGFDFYPSERVSDSAKWPNYVGLSWRKVSDGSEITFSPNRYNLFAANYEQSIGAYLEPPDTVGENFQLVARMPDDLVEKTYISMLNVPAALEGEEFAVEA